MATFHNTLTIARPPDEVFAFLADFGNIPAWNDAITRTVQTSPGPAGVGATYRQTRTIPRRSEEAFEVTDFAPPSRLAIKGQAGPFDATSSYLLQPAAGGTRLTNDVELEPSSALLRPFGPLVIPRVKAAVARNLGTLKQLLEGTRPAAEGNQQLIPQRWCRCADTTAGGLSGNVPDRTTTKIIESSAATTGELTGTHKQAAGVRRCGARVRR